jgi:ABC-type transport system involved in multi-copper enzyme maturation permease subunit
VIRGAVLERELIRTARRRNTYLLRFAFAAALLILLWSFWSSEVEHAMLDDRSRLSRLGRQLFEGYSWLQFILLTTLTPILVAQSVIEERDRRTIELLAITRLTPEEILWGKLLSRILGMGSLVVAGTPVLAMCLSLGGVAPLDVVNVLVQSATVVLSAAAMATFVGLFAPGPVVSAAYTWLWLLCVWGPGAIPAAGIFSGDKGVALFNPAFAIAGAEGWFVVASLVAILPICVGIIRVGAAAFGSMASGADGEDGGYGALSMSVWKLEAIKSRTTALGMLLLAALIVLPATKFVLDQAGSFDVLMKILWVGWNLGFVWVGTVFFMFIARWGLLRQQRVKRKKVGWRRMAKEFQEEDGFVRFREEKKASVGESAGEAEAWGSLLDSASVAPVSGPDPERMVRGSASLLGGRRNLSGRAADVHEATQRRPRSRWFLREVQGNPVFWRETVTRAHGNLGGGLFRAYFLLIMALIASFALGLFDGSQGPTMLLAIAALAGLLAVFTTVVVSSSSMAGERREDTLALVCTTKLGPRGVIVGKLQAIAAFAGPAFVIAAVLALPGMHTFMNDTNLEHESLLSLLVWRWALLTTWGAVVLVFLALSCLSIGLRAKTPGRIWILNLLWTAGLVIGPAIALVLADGSATAEYAVGIFNPLLYEPHWKGDAPSSVFFVSIVGWGMLAALVFRENVRRVGASASS